jgi:hypothetical protein
LKAQQLAEREERQRKENEDEMKAEDKRRHSFEQRAKQSVSLLKALLNSSFHLA